MKKEDELLRDVTELAKETQAGKIQWEILCQTSEYNDIAEKIVTEIDGEQWIVDECFVSYHCLYHDREFLMITYEQIYTCGERSRSENLIFLPPLGIRFFDVDTLAPYAVNADQMLVYSVHMLWLSIMEQYRGQSEKISLEVTPRVR